jgi:penicillin-binding protein 1A
MSKSTVNRTNSKGKFRIYVRLFWTLFILGVGAFASMFVLASKGYFGEMPDFDRLENPNTNLATEIISSEEINKNLTNTDVYTLHPTKL